MKVLRINSRTKTYAYEPFNEEWRFYGQRGLIDKFVEAELDPKCDPMGPDNKLFFVTGMFAGTGVTSSGRVSAGGKSPLTGGIKESTAGGIIGPAMTALEIKGIVIEDQPAAEDPWFVIKIDGEGNLEFLPADEYMGKDTYEVAELIWEKYGKGTGAMVLGRAGEMCYKVASIMCIEFNTGHPCRAMGRGGMGALMGSKKIKAIIMEKSTHRYTPTFADKEKFDAAKKAMFAIATSNPKCQGFTTKGTAGFLTNSNQVTHAIPYHNFRGDFDGEGLTEEQQKEYGTQAWEDHKAERPGTKNSIPCHAGCGLRCSNVYYDKEGNHVTSGFEYETISLFGPNCMIFNMDHTAWLDRWCDEIGIDTMEAGSLLAICMEAGRIPWGDGDAAIAVLRDEMGKGTELGRVMGEGTVALGKYLGVDRVPQVKGQAFAAYDPRTQPGAGIVYAISPMGADHSTGQVVAPAKTPREILAMAANRMLDQCMVDNWGCALVNAAYFGDPEAVPNLYSGLFGGEWDKAKIYEYGKEMFRIERKFNKEAGFTAADDKLPDFCYNEAHPSNGYKFDITNEELEEVFRGMGACYDQL